MLKVMTIVGTRPELIKLAAVIGELDQHTQHTLVHTGQNYDYELSEVFFKELEIRKPDHFLSCAGETAAQTIANVISKVDQILETVKPDAVLLYGDTNSCLAVIPAKRKKIPIFHMEAGNRCFDLRVPEEINRKIVDHLSDINMTLTEHARRYLLQEGLAPETVFVTGSSMPEVLKKFETSIAKSDVLNRLNLKKGQYFLLSTHREENVDDPRQIEELMASLKALHQKYQYPIIFSAHPRTQKRLEALGIQSIPGVEMMKPLGFFDYNHLQMHAFCVLSDSGTITEESSILKFPAVTIRNAHERPEGMDVGVLVMSGLKKERLLDSVELVTKQHQAGFRVSDVEDYMSYDVSKRVSRIIMSYTDYVNRVVWSKI